MQAAPDRLEFAPPPTPGLLRALGLAVLAHAALLAALTWGVHWKREAVTLTAEAELWSAVPQQAAPRLIEAPPEPAPARPAAAAPAPAPPQLASADIALARAKQRLKQQQELEKQRLEQERLNQLKQEKLLLEKKRLQDKKATEEKRKSEQDRKQKETRQTQQEAKQQEARRQENIRRMTGLAGAAGAPGASGTALQSSGPSASYAGRIRARIKPNIVFTDEEVAGNPTAEVEVRTSPNGSIISRKLLKPSGVKSWDDAVLKAIDKTEVLPRDVDGRVPGTLIISFKPRD